jgi:hypothetical protein
MYYYDIKTTSDYEAYVKATAEGIVQDAVGRLKEINFLNGNEDEENAPPIDVEGIECCIADFGIEHEHLDADGIIIHYHGHNIILEHTDNENYGAENIGWDCMQADSFQGIKQNVAFWAFYGDVMGYLDEAITKGAE